VALEAAEQRIALNRADRDRGFLVDRGAGRRPVVAAGRERQLVDDHELRVLQARRRSGACDEPHVDAGRAQAQRRGVAHLLAGIHRDAHRDAALLRPQERLFDRAHAERVVRDIDRGLGAVDHRHQALRHRRPRLEHGLVVGGADVAERLGQHDVDLALLSEPVGLTVAPGIAGLGGGGAGRGADEE
jgi:hypothetical protein